MGKRSKLIAVDFPIYRLLKRATILSYNTPITTCIPVHVRALPGHDPLQPRPLGLLDAALVFHPPPHSVGQADGSGAVPNPIELVGGIPNWNEICNQRTERQWRELLTSFDAKLADCFREREVERDRQRTGERYG